MSFLYGPDGQKIQYVEKPQKSLSDGVIKFKYTPREFYTPKLSLDYLFNCFTQAEEMGEVSYQIRLFEQMKERDAHLATEKDKRILSLQNVPFQVEPFSEEAKDLDVAEFVKNQIESIWDWPDVLSAIQNAVSEGFSVNEIFWNVSEGQATIDQIDFIPGYNFSFYNPKTERVGATPFIYRKGFFEHAEEIPPFKILYHQNDAKLNVPTKSGLMRTAAWLFVGKYYSLRDWLRFSEVYGMPLRIGRYPIGATNQQVRVLKEALEGLGSDAAGVLPQNMDIEFPDSATKGASSTQIYDLLCKYLDRAQSKLWLGQNLSTEVEGIGSYAATKAHIYVRQDIAKRDSFRVANIIRSQLIFPLVLFNFGKEIAFNKLPKYTPIWEEQEDLEKKSRWVNTLFNLGAAFPVSWVEKEFAIPKPEEGEEVLQKQNQFAQQDLNFSEEEEPEESKKEAKILAKAKKTFLEHMSKQANPVIAEMFGFIQKEMDKHGDLEKAKNDLVTWMDDPPLDVLNELFQKGFMAAELQGMYDVDQEG